MGKIAVIINSRKTESTSSLFFTNLRIFCFSSFTLKLLIVVRIFTDVKIYDTEMTSGVHLAPVSTTSLSEYPLICTLSRPILRYDHSPTWEPSIYMSTGRVLDVILIHICTCQHIWYILQTHGNS